MQGINKRENLDWLLALFLGLFALGFGIWFVITNPKVTIQYDCSISEISPDYPVAVKEKCRQLRARNFSENLQKPK